MAEIFQRERRSAVEDAQKVAAIRIDIANEFIPQYQALRIPPDQSLSEDDLQRWVQESREKLTMIEEQHHNQLSDLREYDTMNKLFIEASAAYSNSDAAILANSKLERINEDTLDLIHDELEESLREIVSIGGLPLVQQILQSIMDSTEATPNFSPPAIPHPKIIEACRNNFGPIDKVEWSVDEVATLIESAHERIRTLEDEACANITTTRTQPLIQDMERLREAHRQSSIISSPIPPKRKATQQSVSSQSTKSVPDAMNHVPSRDENIVALENKLENLNTQLFNILSEHDELELIYAKEASETYYLKYQLTFNKIFDVQISQEAADEYQSEIKKKLDNIESDIVTFHLPRYNILTLADNFEQIPLRPKQPPSIEYLLLLSMYLSQPNADQERINQHIIWLSTQISPVINLFSTQANSILLVYLENIIRFHLPTGMALMALQMTIAKLAHRSNDIRDMGLWSILENKMLLLIPTTFNKLDIVNRACLWYFIAAGRPGSELETHFSKHDLSNNCIKEIRENTHLKDFTSLLCIPTISKHIQKSKNHELSTIARGEENLVIVKTKAGTKESVPEEYVWTREKGVVTLSKNGLRFKMEGISHTSDMKVLVQANGDGSEFWFEIDTDDTASAEYFDKYYSDAIMKSAETFVVEYEEEVKEGRII
ncbi:hypothetical protein BGAL_0465g00010 [Botrytis galanthina]|uniref:Uncharacterized protein n=1 Tax=Botrytis galanthina TaxID=278940 RepID=A0A4S8QVR1_9HELO|nr:hypothetical protein BGAL_0465g00010 [Botrytis galanthina]